MRALILLLALGCAGHNRHVFVPSSARDCWEGCNEKAKACEPGDMPSAEAYVDTASLTARDRARTQCQDERHDCLLACPGARED
jgi:hypothetical protein